MKVVFLPSAIPDLRWFSRHYQTVFPQGGSAARKRMAKAVILLSENPAAGRPLPEAGQRELVILRTPFVLVYRIAASEIEILRLRDARADPSARNTPERGPEE